MQTKNRLPPGWPEKPLILPKPLPTINWGEPSPNGEGELQYVHGFKVTGTSKENQHELQITLTVSESAARMCQALGMQITNKDGSYVTLTDKRPALLFALAGLFTPAQRKKLDLLNIVPQQIPAHPPGPAPMVARIPLTGGLVFAAHRQWYFGANLRRRAEAFVYIGPANDVNAGQVVEVAGWGYSTAFGTPWTPHAKCVAPIAAFGCKETHRSLQRANLPRGLFPHMRHAPALFPWRKQWALAVPDTWSTPERTWNQSAHTNNTGYTSKSSAAALRMSRYAPPALARILSDANSSGGLRALDPGKITLIDTENENFSGKPGNNATRTEYLVRHCAACHQTTCDPSLKDTNGIPCPHQAACPNIQTGKVPLIQIENDKLIPHHKHASPRVWREIAEHVALPLIQADKSNDQWDDSTIQKLLPQGESFRESQLEGIRFALERPVSLDATIMGGGKTLKALLVFAATIEQNPAARCLAVVPASLVTKWGREASRWLKPNIPHHIVTTKTKQLPPPGTVTIASYDTLRINTTLFQIQWQAISADEAHYAKNPKADRSRALLSLESPRWLFLTGTPVHNRPIDLQPMLAKACPQAFSNAQRFRKSYGIKDAKNLSPDERAMLESLGPFLRDTVMWRPPVSEIRALIPEKMPPEIKEVMVGSGKVAEIRQQEVHLLQELKRQKQGKLAIFAQLQALRLACARMKLPTLTTLVQKLAQEESGHPFLVFSHHQEIVEAVAQAINQAGLSCQPCHGGYTPKQRQQMVDDFQSGKLDALSLGIMAAREGLDIQRARCVVFAEFAWSPSDIAQAEGRAYRPGQEHALRTIYVVVPGTLDAYIAATLAAKDQAANTALGDLDPETITQALGGLGDLEDIEGIGV